MSRPAHNRRAQLAGAALFAAIGLAAAAGFLKAFAPAPHRLSAHAFTAYDRASMQALVTPAAVAARLKTIEAFGSRSPGQPGHLAMADYLRQAFTRAGLELIEQPVTTIHPTLTSATLFTPDGQPQDLALYPLFPNHLQPMVTPDGGLSGELFLVNDQSLKEATSLKDKIALLDLADQPPSTLKREAKRYAAAGFKAMLVTHREGLDQIQIRVYSDLTLNLPVNFVRLIADPGILSLKGQNVRLEVHTSFQHHRITNLVAVLKAGQPTGEALVVPVSYDGLSALPDLNPGSLQALQIALQQQLLDGLLPYQKDLRRDVVFVATGGDFNAQDSLYQFLRAVGQPGRQRERRQELVEDLARQTELSENMDVLLSLFDHAAFAIEPQTSGDALARLSPAIRQRFDEQYRHVLRTRVLDLNEALMQAHIHFEKTGAMDMEGEAYRSFREAKKQYDNLNNRTSYPLPRLLGDPALAGFHLRQALLDRFTHLADHHQQRVSDTTAALALNDLFSRYTSFAVISPLLNPLGLSGKESISFTCGRDIEHEDQAKVFNEIVAGAIQKLNLGARIGSRFWGMRLHGNTVQNILSDFPTQAQLWSRLSYPAYSVVSLGADYSAYGSPQPLPLAASLDNITNSMAVLGEMVLSVAFGNGPFAPTKFRPLHHYYGRVFAANVGNSVVPNYPMEDALVMDREWSPAKPKMLGKPPVGYRRLLTSTDPYGSYDLPLCAADFATDWVMNPEAAFHGPNGMIQYYSDRGNAAQQIFKSIDISQLNNDAPINLVLSRATTVAILDRTNPQTFKDYTSATLLKKRGLQPFPSQNSVASEDGLLEFIKPDETFFVALNAGAADNELVQTTRAFMLGTPTNLVFKSENEIDGQGYLAQDHPILYNVAAETARSMLYLNQKRLDLQRRYGMADEMTLAFNDRALSALEVSEEEGLNRIERDEAASTSVTYSTLNHPVIRRSISEAVWGILWYMGLLVPFVFFFEKLVFASADIRRALLIQSLVFLLVFTLLRILHPAFEMIRSSVMILLGFVILLISCGITLILSGKFKENLEALQHAQRQVKGAQAHTTGIVLTAFMLGLNNMNRRKVRTGLTCATLVLLTFVMICFTSVQSDIVDTRKAIAKAPYQGLLVKNDSFAAITIGEVHALEKRYGNAYAVLSRNAYLGIWDYRSQNLVSPDIEIVRGQDDQARSRRMKSLLLLSVNEPLRHQIKFVAGPGWFTEEQTLDSKQPSPVLLSDTAAADLNLTAEDLERGDGIVQINGTSFRVYGIFSASHLNRLTDLDGDTLLPFDVEGMINPRQKDDLVLANREDPRVDAADLVIGLQDNFNARITAQGKVVDDRILSVAIDMSKASYKTARRDVESFLEQTGDSAYYGIDGIAYLGKRSRERSLAGLVDMLIPLLIAGLTVLNTMKGSVYERRDEIFVYNAVGIAPRYVFFMFIAEALVYAVIGSLLGYILSQGTGRILTELGWTGGLNMNFTSLATVYASLTIAVAVFLSTLFPARSAMEIASPAEDAGWSLPPAEGDLLHFDLPFTFTHRDRIAVLGFFHTFLSQHGEGSSGPFFAGPSRLDLSERTDDLANGASIPKVECMIWLKPFDLGVSQRLEIELATDPATGEYISRVLLTRVSGTRESWERLNTSFVARIRQHFLHWRAVSEGMKVELYAEAKELLEQSTADGVPHHG